MEPEDDDGEGYYEPAVPFPNPDPVVNRGDLLIRLAYAVDNTENDEARCDLLDYMALTIETVAGAMKKEKTNDLH